MWKLTPQQRVIAAGVALGQVISALVAGTGVFSTVLADAGVSAPTAQSLLNYVLLAVVFGGYRCWLAWQRRRRRQQPGSVGGLAQMVDLDEAAAAAASSSSSIPLWQFALLALVDVEANYLVVKAYHYTTITSIMLIDCWTIPCVMVLSRCCLGTLYRGKHAVGVLVCVIGLGLLVVSDYLRARDDPGSGGTSDDGGLNVAMQVIGDIITFAAATLYAISNVGQEYIVKRHDRTQFLAWLGVFGTVIGGVQLAVLERQEVAQALSAGGAATRTIVGATIGFALCLFAMYAATSTFLRVSDSTVFNLSLLTSDVWAIIAAVALFGQRLHPLYLGAFAVIVIGLVTYNVAPPPGTLPVPPAITAFGGLSSEVPGSDGAAAVSVGEVDTSPVTHGTGSGGGSGSCAGGGAANRAGDGPGPAVAATAAAPTTTTAAAPARALGREGEASPLVPRL